MPTILSVPRRHTEQIEMSMRITSPAAGVNPPGIQGGGAGAGPRSPRARIGCAVARCARRAVALLLLTTVVGCSSEKTDFVPERLGAVAVPEAGLPSLLARPDWRGSQPNAQQRERLESDLARVRQNAEGHADYPVSRIEEHREQARVLVYVCPSSNDRSRFDEFLSDLQEGVLLTVVAVTTCSDLPADPASTG